MHGSSSPTRARLRAAAFAAILAGSLGAAGAAQAATVADGVPGDPNALQIFAGSGEINKITVTSNGSSVTVTDTGGTTLAIGSTDCTRVAGSTTAVVCRRIPTQLVISGDDQDDTLTNET